MTEHLRELSAPEASICLDDLSRPLITGGPLEDPIDNSSVAGVTTNPTIFAAALSQSDAYGEPLTAIAPQGKSVDEAAFALTTQDLRNACDILMPVYRATDGQDGRVSIEVDPRLATKTARTVERAKELINQVDRPNVHIKVPATVEGLPAITQILAEGISVSVSLVFSPDRYRAVMDAFLTGLEQARRNGLDVSQIHSVTSFYVSQVDVDKGLDALGTEDAKALRGKAAVANAHLADQAHKEVFSTPRWEDLATQGANSQRLLWPSTGVESPSYKETTCAVELAAPNTVNTIPAAKQAHREVQDDQWTRYFDDARLLFDSLDRVGVSHADVEAVLEREGVEGVEQFAQSWAELLYSVKDKVGPAGP